MVTAMEMGIGDAVEGNEGAALTMVSMGEDLEIFTKVIWIWASIMVGVELGGGEAALIKDTMERSRRRWAALIVGEILTMEGLGLEGGWEEET